MCCKKLTVLGWHTLFSYSLTIGYLFFNVIAGQILQYKDAASIDPANKDVAEQTALDMSDLELLMKVYAAVKRSVSEESIESTFREIFSVVWNTDVRTFSHQSSHIERTATKTESEEWKII